MIRRLACLTVPELEHVAEVVSQRLEHLRRKIVTVPRSVGRQVVSQSRQINGIVFTQEKVNCGSPLCTVCREGRLHGPYYYCYMWRGGAVRCFYVAKPGRKKEE